MSATSLEQLQYPVGRFAYPRQSSAQERAQWVRAVAETPARLREAVSGLTEEQLSTPYREGGWMLRQVAHHLPDSHMNSYVRYKMALTEDVPAIQPYDEAAWAKLADSMATPVQVSLDLLEALHARWVRLLESLSDADFARRFHHPEAGTLDLGCYLAGFAWHGRHHVAHITSLRQRMGW
jgi:hypothetical protein